ncbi:restriction endonuclease subunit S [Pelobium sp.]|nr:restriction endonuclease subunit S [Pelobium sp.]MDA9554843.1 restriction endonuclease subunit S [Pelobium sp.]
MNKELPEGWKWVKLGDVCKTTSGGTPNRGIKSYYEGDIPWVKSGELDKGLILETEEKITEEAIKNSSAKIFPKGTLLIALYGATIGKLAFLGVDAATNQAICGIYENPNLDSKYLYYYLLHKKQKLVNQGIGGAQPNISQTILKNLDLPQPPLPIQQTIVSKIEELFSELDKGMENLKTAQQQLKVYRQSVLKWAFEGKLTNSHNTDSFDLPMVAEPQEDYERAKHLRNQENHGADNEGLPEGWKWVKLGDITQKVEKVKRKEKLLEEKLIYLDIGGINNETNKIISHKEFLWKDAPSRAQQIVNYNDVLFSTVRTYMKNIAIIDNEKFDKQIASSGFCVIRHKPNISLPNFLFYLSISDLFVNPLNEMQTGSSYPAVRDKDIFSQKVALPPISEQVQIVQEIESRLSVADKMQETIQQSLLQAESLRQSILKKAFEGELVK